MTELPITLPNILLALALVLLGVLIGRMTAPRERKTVVYQPAGGRAGGGSRGSGDDRDGAMRTDDAELEAHIRNGQMIPAIKRYRELYGTGLKEAKDACEALRARLSP